MVSKIKTVLGRVFGWILLIVGLITVFSMIFGGVFDLVALLFFIGLTFVGLWLTGYGRKKPTAPTAPIVLTTEKSENEATPNREAAPPIEAESEQSDEELTEDWAYRKVMENYEPKSSLFRIEYVGAGGKESSRDIQILRFEESNGRLSLYAYCHLAKAIRQFIVDRVISISFNGHTVDNPQAFLWDKYKNSASLTSLKKQPEPMKKKLLKTKKELA